VLCICLFHIFTTVITDHSATQHLLAGLCNGDAVCLLWDRDCSSVCYSDKRGTILQNLWPSV